MKTYIVIIDECELIKISLIKMLPEYANLIMFYDNLEDALKALGDIKELRRYIFIVDLEVTANEGVKELTKRVPQKYYSIIILTSMPVDYVENILHEEGIARIFVKPFNVKELCETITKLYKQDQ
ncbi:MAG: hypothetical protein ACP5JP_07070 [bacterium]